MGDTVLAELEEAVAEFVRPVIQADGGDIELVAFEGNVLTVVLSGRCGGCPGAPETQAGLIVPVVSRAAGRPVTVKILRSNRRKSSEPAPPAASGEPS